MAGLTGQAQLARKAVTQVRSMRAISFVPVTDSLIDEAIDIACDYGLRAGDAVYAAVARRENVPVVSFDSELLNKPNAIIATIHP